MAREFAVPPPARPALATALAIAIGLPLIGRVPSILKRAPGHLDRLVIAQAAFGCALPRGAA